MVTQRCREKPGQYRQDRPAAPVRPEPGPSGGAAPSPHDHSTMISASLDAWLRPSRTSQPKTRSVIKYNRRKDTGRDHVSPSRRTPTAAQSACVLKQYRPSVKSRAPVTCRQRSLSKTSLLSELRKTGEHQLMGATTPRASRRTVPRLQFLIFDHSSRTGVVGGTLICSARSRSKTRSNVKPAANPSGTRKKSRRCALRLVIRSGTLSSSPAM